MVEGFALRHYGQCYILLLEACGYCLDASGQ